MGELHDLIERLVDEHAGDPHPAAQLPGDRGRLGRIDVAR